MDDDYEMFKIVIIGSMGTGKTNISMRYVKSEYIEGHKPTVGVQFLSKIAQVRNQRIKVTLWDTAGQERYKSLSKVYYKGASAVLIVYDVTDIQSYLDVQAWMRLANQNLNLNDVVLMVAGNKMDLENDRKVTAERPIRQYKNNFDVDCWEVSAKTGYNVNELFTDMLEKVYSKNVDAKSSIFMDIGDYGSGISYVDRDSMPLQQPKKEIKSRQIAISEVVEEKEEDDIVLPFPVQVSNKVTSKQHIQNGRLTLTAADQKKRIDENKNKKQKKKCC